MSSKLAAGESVVANSNRFSPSKSALFVTVGASALLVEPTSSTTSRRANGPAGARSRLRSRSASKVTGP